MFNSADDIILLSNGRTIYSGALADIPDTLAKAGFVCPQYYNMADYSKCPIGILRFLRKRYRVLYTNSNLNQTMVL